MYIPKMCDMINYAYTKVLIILLNLKGKRHTNAQLNKENIHKQTTQIRKGQSFKGCTRWNLQKFLPMKRESLSKCCACAVRLINADININVRVLKIITAHVLLL